MVEMFKRTVRISKRKRADSYNLDPASQDWAECKDFALKRLSTNSTYRLASVLKCCKDETYIDKQLLQELLDDALKNPRLMDEFTPIGVSTTVQCLGMLRRKAIKRAAAEGAFFDTTVQHFVGELLSQTLNRGLYSRLEFSVRELSSTMHGMGLMFSNVGLDGQIDLTGVADTIVGEFVTKGRGGFVMPQSLSSLLVGCAYLQYENLDLLSQVIALVTQTLQSDDQLQCQAMANITWSIGRLGFVDGDLMCALKRAISEHVLVNMKNQELANLVEGLGLLGFEDKRVLDLLGKEVAKTDRQEGFKQQELANVFYGLGLCGIKNDATQAVLQQILKKPRLRSFKGQSLARIVSAMATLDLHDRPILTTLSREICSLDRLEKYGMNEINDLVASFKELKFWVDPILLPLHEELEERTSTFSPRYWRI